MRYIERCLLEARLLGKSEGEKAIERAKLVHGVSNSRELPFDVRYQVSTPLVERGNEEVGEPMHVSPTNMGRMGYILENVGPDVLAQWAEEEKAILGFDSANRPSNQSLPEFLRNMARNDGWKE